MNADPEELRDAGRRMVDLIVELAGEEDADPVLPAVAGADVRARFEGPPPEGPATAAELVDDMGALVRLGRRKNGHPRFFGYVCASADPVGALADAVASAVNQNLTAWRSAPGAVELERMVVRWLAELVGFGAEHGLLTSGGSMANLIGVACGVARARETARVYRTAEAHLSLDKACRLLGLRDERVRGVPHDGDRRMLPDELDRMLAADGSSACVCASAGTANTGAIDPLVAIADVCARHGAWLHVDGAYGAPAAMTDEHAFLRDGLARADSLSLDPHKWFFAPFDAGCVLVRDENAALAAFAGDSEYVAVTQDDPIERFAFFERGPELSRRARALKVWAILKARGTGAIRDAIARNVALRRHLDARVEAEPRLEALGSGLSIACFRYVPAGAASADECNRRILDALNASGRFFLSPTTLDGRFALRVCIVNFRTTEADVDLLVDEVLRLGAGAS